MELKGHTIGFKGEYSATVLKADGTVKEFLNEEKTLRSGDVIKNRLLDNFFTLLNLNATPLWNPTGFRLRVAIKAGTSASAVLNTQTALVAPFGLSTWPTADSETDTISQNGSSYTMTRSFTATFGLGAIVGNVAELGVAFSTNGNSGSGVQSRALVVDSQGNPTVISVLAEEQLIITYSLTAVLSLDDVVTQVDSQTSNGIIATTVTQRIALLSQVNIRRITNNEAFSFVFNGGLGPVNSMPGGSNTVGSDGASSLTPTHKDRTSNFSLTQGNLSGGITAFALGQSDSPFKIGVSPPIQKNNSRTLSITVRRTFSRLD